MITILDKKLIKYNQELATFHLKQQKTSFLCILTDAQTLENPGKCIT